MEHLIEPEDWGAFCADFSREHGGWLGTVGVIATTLLDADPSAGDAAHPISGEVPFHGIDLEEGGETVLAISAGDPPRHLVHRVRRPQRVFMLEGEGGRHGGLRIDAADGDSTLLLFRVTVAPEVVDGTVGP